MIKKFVIGLTGLFMLLAVLLPVAQIAKATVSVPGSVKTLQFCGQQGNINPFSEGATVWGEGKNFTDNADYQWTVTKVNQPNQGTVVNSGTFHLNNDEDTFCIAILTAPTCSIDQNGHAEYKFEVQQKIDGRWHKVDSDNFFVKCQKQEVERLILTPICSDKDGLSKWKITNPNNFSVKFSWELTLVSGSTVKEKGKSEVSANSDVIVETSTPGDVRMTIYWCDPAKLPGKCVTLHECATNEQVGKCTIVTPTPTPTVTATPTGIGGATPEVTPQVLGTSEEIEEALPVTGADSNYVWLYYFVIISALLGTYYLKTTGWKKMQK